MHTQVSCLLKAIKLMLKLWPTEVGTWNPVEDVLVVIKSRGLSALIKMDFVYVPRECNYDAVPLAKVGVARA